MESGSIVSIGSMGEGNTKPPPKVRISSSKYWIFTYNNYTEESLAQLVLCFKKNQINFVFGKEVGESGTPHLQGYVEGKVKFRPLEKIKGGPFKKIHWEKRKGTRQQAYMYCVKDGNFQSDFVISGAEFNARLDLTMDDMPEPRPFQKRILEKHAGPPPLFHRQIYWYWDPRGNIGKTMLARYLVLKEGEVYCQGADRHIMALAYKMPSFHYVFGLARYDKVEYKSLEKISDGLYMSGFGTEATGMVNRKTPWVICFANFPPCEAKLSADRWVIENLAETEMLYELDSCELPSESDEES